jgi:signal transduction histidine kinase
VTRRNWVFDISLATVVGALGQLEAWWGISSTHRQGPVWAQALLYAVTAVLLAFRRVRPLTCQGAILVVSAAEFAAFGSPEGNGVALPSAIAAYTVARRLDLRRSWWGLLIVCAYWVFWSTFDPMNAGATESERLLTLFWLSPFVIAWLSGTLVRLTLQNREQRRINTAQRATQAVSEERNRIARELHDVIGHSVSVMTVQTAAVRRRLTPEQTVEREALETVESVGREALAEMRRIVGVLRQAGDDPDPDLEPPPGLDQLDRLAEKFRTAGLPVTVEVTGASRELAPGLDLTAYRLVQEGLTNTLRHARDAHAVRVEIDYRDSELELAVRDDGLPSDAPGSAAHASNGLLGMRERVAVYGGSLEARPRPEGGFELVATLPLESR